MTTILQRLHTIPLLLTGGALTTFALFYLMQALIHQEFAAAPRSIEVDLESMFLEEWTPDPVIDTPRPPRPEEPAQLPDLPPPPAYAKNDTGFGVRLTGGTVAPPPQTGTDGLFSASNNALPLVKTTPTYPQRALARGIEGYVVVQFDVNEQGLVVNAAVLYAEPAGVFDSAALKALERWRYQPKVDDGRPVMMYGLQQKLSFTLQD